MSALKRLPRPHLALPPRLTTPPTRTFLPNPFASAASQPQIQTLRAARTLPYPSAPIYSIIADVPSYADFLPYCQRSTITHWSAPDALTGRSWPSIGILTSGFGNLTESFTSRVYCVPGKVVESIGGDTSTSLSREEIQHHLVDSVDVKTPGTEGLLTHLRSKWTVEAVGENKTRIELALEFAFANPFYAALSGGAAPKVAEAMVRAFEERVRVLMAETPALASARLEDLDGSRLRH
jgi:coenzyme Q-binding protein COQ10